jgi:hypothetical protein
VEAMEWLEVERSFVVGSHRHRRFIINVDQTPVRFSTVSRTEPIGSRTVNVRSSTDSNKGISVAVTVTADGYMLPIVGFQGVAIARRTNS